MSSVHFLIDKTLGKYKVLEHVGHGGMAEVYKGQHVQLDRMVAVKVLHPFLADEEGFVVRFQREARIVATLRHPNIVQVYDFDYNDELSIYYMIMEFIDGPTLKSYLKNGLLSTEETARIGSLIAEALDYAHQRGMVHRDIKPANIMFIAEGQPVLTDFGIAKMLTLSGLTASGAMVGTPAYMAPEVGMGKPGTSASDIYSLGIVLYQMVTEKLPFESESPMGMVMQHINDTPPPPSQFMPALSPDLESVILRALQKQPEDRYSSAAEMASALRQAIGLDTPRSAAAFTPPPVIIPKPPVEDRSEDDRLLRTWPLTPLGGFGASTTITSPIKSVKSVTPPPAVVEPEEEVVPPEEPPQKKRKRSPLLRLLWAVFFMLLLFVGGSAFVIISRIDISPEVRAWLPSAITDLYFPLEATPIATLSPILTPTPKPEATPDLAVVLTPTVTPTPLTCNFRFRLESVRLEPDDILPPESDFVAYLRLINSGNCSWPEGMRLDFVEGAQFGAPSVVPIESLEPGESAQVLLPMQTPVDLDTYTSEWELRQSNGRSLGNRITIAFEVADLPAFTPVVEETPELVEPSPEALALNEPELLSWNEDLTHGEWSGVLRLQATGGNGNYRYYRQEVREDTQINETLSFQWRRCDPISLKIWVISGDMLLEWVGSIDYPAPETCE